MRGEELVAFRRMWNLSQNQLALALGIDAITVSRWERGLQEPPAFLALAIEALENRIRIKGGINMQITERPPMTMEDVDLDALFEKILAPQPPTYEKIQKEVKRRFGFTPETCWIAHVKEIMGLKVKEAHNRQGTERMRPCPSDKIDIIKTVIESLMS